MKNQNNLECRSKNQRSLDSMKQCLLMLFQRFGSHFDLNKINQHQSLTFLKKKYNKDPSFILKIILTIIGIAILFVEGFRLISIAACYIIPIGIIIVKLCQSIRCEKNLLLDQTNSDRNSLQLSRRKAHEPILGQSMKSDLQQQIKSKQMTQQQVGLSQSPKIGQAYQINSSLPSTVSEYLLKKQTLNSKSRHPSQENFNSAMTKNQLCKIFIIFSLISLILQLVEPISLLVLQSLFNLIYLTVNFIAQLIFQANLWSLIIFPIQFHFIATLVNLGNISYQTQISYIAIRILLSTQLLSLNRQKISFFQKYLLKFDPINLFKNSKVHLKNQ